MSDLSLRSKILLGFLIPIGLAAIASTVVYQVLESSRSTSKWIAQSNQIVATANALSKSLLAAETGERGFAITGKHIFLEPYIDGSRSIKQTAARLRALVADNPAQLQRIEEAIALFQRWQAEVAESVIAARQAVPVGFVLAGQKLYVDLLKTHLAEARYLISESPVDLSRWGKALGKLRADMTALLEMEEDPQHRAVLEEMLTLIEAYEADFQVTVDSPGAPSRANDVHAQLDQTVQALLVEHLETEQSITRLIASGKGKAMIDQFRELTEEFVSIEQELLDQRIAANERAVRRAKVIAWAGPVVVLGLALVIAVIVAFKITRSMRSVAEAAQDLAAGNLQRRVEVRGDHEVGKLAQAFNAMAERLAAVVEAEHRDKEVLAARVDELVERRTHEAVLLNEMGEMLQAAINMEEAYMVVGRLAAQLFPEVNGALFILNPSRNLLEAATGWGPSPPGGKDAIFTPDECWALRRGRPHVVREPDADLLCQHLSEPSAYLCVPLVAQGEAMGIFHLSSSRTLKAPSMVWTDAKRQLAITVAEHLALALANLKLRETLRSQSIRDPLTGLFNRRYMEETLEREILRAKRNHTSLSVIMIDIDHFKQFNDKFGHDAGDVVLQKLSSLLQSGFRGEDIPCRHGGEEFALLLPDTSLEDACQRAEQLRVSVEKLEIYYREKPLGRITLSIGIAVFPDHGSEPKMLLRLADEALYRAKANGRNQVMVA